MGGLEDFDVRALREHYRIARSEGRSSWASFIETRDPAEPRQTFVIALRIHESEADARACAGDDAAWAGVQTHDRRVWGRVREDGGIEARGVVALSGY